MLCCAGVVILGKTVEELQELAAKYKQPAYRAKQLYDGVLQGAKSLDQITTIPAAWRAKLAADGVGGHTCLIAAM
jgi:23S rRNA (adenine2503-C2)-methyltransferase